MVSKAFILHVPIPIQWILVTVLTISISLTGLAQDEAYTNEKQQNYVRDIGNVVSLSAARGKDRDLLSLEWGRFITENTVLMTYGEYQLSGPLGHFFGMGPGLRHYFLYRRLSPFAEVRGGIDFWDDFITLQWRADAGLSYAIDDFLNIDAIIAWNSHRIMEDTNTGAARDFENSVIGLRVSFNY